MKKFLFLLFISISLLLNAQAPSLIGTWDISLSTGGGGAFGKMTFDNNGHFTMKLGEAPDTHILKGKYSYSPSERSLTLSHSHGKKLQYTLQRVTDTQLVFSCEYEGMIEQLRITHPDTLSFRENSSSSEKISGTIIHLIKNKKVEEIIKILSSDAEIDLKVGKKRYRGSEAQKHIEAHLNKIFKNIKELKQYSSNAIRVYSKISEWEECETLIIFRIENNTPVITLVVVKTIMMG
ncbi:MAG TPA: hypothetical protein PKZ64_04945 [Spirochaetota bacterium]|nr:hypothetical protein [Spirochaetota bacterium]